MPFQTFLLANRFTLTVTVEKFSPNQMASVGLPYRCKRRLRCSAILIASIRMGLLHLELVCVMAGQVRPRCCFAVWSRYCSSNSSFPHLLLYFFCTTTNHRSIDRVPAGFAFTVPLQGRGNRQAWLLYKPATLSRHCHGQLSLEIFPLPSKWKFQLSTDKCESLLCSCVISPTSPKTHSRSLCDRGWSCSPEHISVWDSGDVYLRQWG